MSFVPSCPLVFHRLLDEIAALHSLTKAKMADIQAMRIA
jgi:hypothetical protein